MNISLNGEKKEIPDGVTVLGLLDFMKIQPERVAVELNMDIIKKDAYGATQINDGDSVEVVSFMAGGQGAENREKNKCKWYGMEC